MVTFILPGGSVHNRDWAEETKKNLAPEVPAVAAAWEHWQTGTQEPDWLEKEMQKILDQIGTEKVNLLAKSIGTVVAMKIVQKHPELVNKLILCGLPLNDLDDGDETFYHPLENLPPAAVLVFQNEADPHGPFTLVESFLHDLNPEIRVINKPGTTHDYPYFADFKKFLT
jgi:pimeloyl-ACP methyl ester carboxylesterase